MRDTVDKLWDYIENRLFYKGTGMLYDTVIDESTPLPTLRDIKSCFPNKNGCGTLTEDCMISGGTALQGLLLRIKREGKGSEFAKRVVNGLLSSAESGKDGFLPRSIQPIDGVSHYPDTSRDQITMLFFSLVQYFYSGICDEVTGDRIKSVIKNAVDRAVRNVTAENGYDLLDENGEFSVNCIMWGETVKAHEIGRLPFMYLCDFAVNKRESSYNAYLRLRDEAISRSLPIGEHYHFYTLQQMAATLYIAREFDDEYSEKYRELLKAVADYAVMKTEQVEKELKTFDDGFFTDRTDWRKFYSVQNAAIIGILEGMAYKKVSEKTKELMISTAKRLFTGNQRSALPVHFAVAFEMMLTS